MRWREVELGDVCDRVTVGHVGPMAAEYLPNGIPFLRSKNVREYRIVSEDLRFVSADFHQRLKKSRLVPGDVVIVRTGTPGTAAVIPPGIKEANCSDLVVVTPGPGLLSHFLAYYLNAAAHRQIDSAIVGAVQQHFNVGSARKLRIPLPPMAEQAAIVTVLRHLDDKIELNREMNRTLEVLAQAIFRSWFVDFDPVVAKAEGREPFGMDADTAALFPDRFVDSELGPIPEGWEVCGVGDIAELHRVMVDPGALAPDTPYVGLEHIPRQAMTLDTWGQASDVMSGKTTFKQGHVLFGKLRPYFHKVVRAPFAGVCSTDVLVIRPVFPEDSGFVLHTAASSAFVAHADAGSSGTRMPRARWEHMQRFRVVRPPKPLSARFSSIASDLIGLAEANTRESLTLTSLRDLLLPKLLSGEIRVPEAAEMVEDVA